ncbi:MAG: IS1182 family transposase [Elusimicrobiota bacterium]
MDYWAKAKLNRSQAMLFSPTLDETVGENHPVRFFDEVLRGVDWKKWEMSFNGEIGQPPIHPRIIAGALLYGLNRRIRSSRQLEDACINRVDFMWLVEGRRIDHTTFCKFRTKYGEELKGLFRQVGQVAMKMGVLQLLAVSIDGTRVRSNSSRHNTARQKGLEKILEDLQKQIDEALAQMAEADRREDGLFGEESSGNELPKGISKLKDRQEKLKEALAEVKQSDEARKKKHRDRRETGTQAPLADLESKVLPNKEGGFAPNYTPMATIENGGFIVDADVINDSSESKVAPEAVDRIEENFGKRPKEMLADGAYGSGENLSEMENRGVELLTPGDESRVSDKNPARREDPEKPVPEDKWEDLPRRKGTSQLSATAFTYDKERDCYWCPMGRKLGYYCRDRKGGATRIYQSKSCEGCGLAAICLSKTGRLRTVRRDQYEEHRDRLARRMSSKENQEKYSKRFWMGETPFAHIKAVIGLRQFLLRGMGKVKTEWLWACTAYNLGKLAIQWARERDRLDLAPG